MHDGALERSPPGEIEERLVEGLRRWLRQHPPLSREDLLANGFRGRPVSERELLEVERVVALADEGLSQKHIAGLIELDEATISRRMKRAREAWHWIVDGPFCALPAERCPIVPNWTVWAPILPYTHADFAAARSRAT